MKKKHAPPKNASARRCEFESRCTGKPLRSTQQAVHACGAFAALLAVAAILNFNSAGQISELFEYNHVGAHSDDFAGTVEPATLNDDEVLAFELIIHIKCIVLR